MKLIISLSGAFKGNYIKKQSLKIIKAQIWNNFWINYYKRHRK